MYSTKGKIHCFQTPHERERELLCLHLYVRVHVNVSEDYSVHMYVCVCVCVCVLANVLPAFPFRAEVLKAPSPGLVMTGPDSNLTQT